MDADFTKFNVSQLHPILKKLAGFYWIELLRLELLDMESDKRTALAREIEALEIMAVACLASKAQIDLTKAG